MRGIYVTLYPLVSNFRRLVVCAVLAIALSDASGFAQGDLKSEAGIPEFAPGVLTVIAPEIEPADTFATHDLVEIRANQDLKRNPNWLSESRSLYQMADDANFRRNVWCLEFSFKPLRMLMVDIPQPTGKMQRKLIWYMVYRVRNTGMGIVPKQQEDGTYATVEQNLGPQRFIPRFFLTSFDRDREDKPVNKSYLDRVLPSAIDAIERREFSGHELLTSAAVAEKLLDPVKSRQGDGLWGVATWEDVDPEMDFFAIFVGGLTNAYRWEDARDFRVGAAPGTGRTFERKMLQLNFWRPGDAIAENENEIRFGTAPGMADVYGSRAGVAYQWVYR